IHSPSRKVAGSSRPPSSTRFPRKGRTRWTGSSRATRARFSKPAARISSLPTPSEGSRAHGDALNLLAKRQHARAEGKQLVAHFNELFAARRVIGGNGEDPVHVHGHDDRYVAVRIVQFQPAAQDAFVAERR